MTSFSRPVYSPHSPGPSPVALVALAYTNDSARQPLFKVGEHDTPAGTGASASVGSVTPASVLYSNASALVAPAPSMISGSHALPPPPLGTANHVTEPFSLSSKRDGLPPTSV